jgi:hypothetical protein
MSQQSNCLNQPLFLNAGIGELEERQETVLAYKSPFDTRPDSSCCGAFARGLFFSLLGFGLAPVMMSLVLAISCSCL